MSDNMDYMGPRNSLGDREGDQMFFWQEDKINGNDSPDHIWSRHYNCIEQANQALASIEELGGAKTEELQNTKGEALLLRAYNSFLLVNEFSMAYNSKTSDKDMGVYYSTSPESLTEIQTQTNRGTVASVYEMIAKDIEAGIPLINDNYKVPKYHFNRRRHMPLLHASTFIMRSGIRRRNMQISCLVATQELTFATIVHCRQYRSVRQIRL